VTAEPRRPLGGRTVVVTRPEHQSDALAGLLTQRGAEVLRLPTIRIEPVDRDEMRRIVDEAGSFDWIVFTSANGVAAFQRAVEAAGGTLDRFAGSRVCAIGPATAEAAEAAGLPPDLVPASHIAEGLVEALTPLVSPGGRVLYPRAERVREVVVSALRGTGVEVVEIPVYRTVPDPVAAEELRRRVRGGEVDVITFTSGSAVASFVDLVGAEVGDMLIASIGPATSQVARSRGLAVHIEAPVHTAEGLAAAIEAHYERPEH
jgi:uroporphyrinogen III methyltransferase / synthase